MNNRINKILIANRGEIAVRIARSCKELAIDYVALASEADKETPYAQQAKILEILKGSTAQETYLNVEKIINIAKKHKVDAIHPGYGFLSENFLFAKTVEEEGIIFIGPLWQTIEIMGSKTISRDIAKKHGVPLVPGAEGKLSDEELIKEAESLGFPLMIKAAAGGGGRGMRVVNNQEELQKLLPRARQEALKFFASDEVYLEKFIANPRHIEVQILGDNFGNIVHLGTRECSIQRRNQKLIEEAPAPNLNKEIEEAICHSALNLAKAVSYRSAGTVEFLLKDKEFYFLEMNTRIQVEHPVTEEVTGVDLIKEQISIAQNTPLSFTQKDIKIKGHAIEYRIYAEDIENNFNPQTGRIRFLKEPKSEYLRIDSWIEKGVKVTPFYDSMLAKLIVIGKDRGDVLKKSKGLLSQYYIGGIKTTILLYRWILTTTPFLRSKIDIKYLDKNFSKEELLKFKASLIKDPLHLKPIGGAEVKSLYHYRSKKHNQDYIIEVVHRKDGYFLAVPLTKDGKRANAKNCRLSNGLNEAVVSVIDDVLEKNKPSQIFNA